MSVHRLKIESDSLTAVQVSPVWSGKIEWSREAASVYMRAKPVGDFTFLRSECETVKAVPDCETIYIYLEEKCGEDWVERWRGRFTTYDCKFNDNLCTATVEPKTVDDYECFVQNWDTERVVASAGDTVITRAFLGNYEAGLGCCTVTSAFPPALPVCTAPAGMCYDSTYSTYISGGVSAYTSCFHRITGTGTTIAPPIYGSGWTLLSGTTWWRCPDGSEAATGVFDNGRWFNDVLEYLADLTTCGLTLRSHFFGINASHAAPPSNDAYDFAADKMQDVQIHQKSDIKRPDDTNPAQGFVWKMSLKKTLEDLETMCNIFWKIDGDDLILEHLSYFEDTPGLDLTQRNIVLEYGKQEGGAPNEEQFAWMDGDATFSESHAGFPITYGECGTGKVERKVNYFSNDVVYIRTVENQEEVADAGFCLISTTPVSGFYGYIEENAAWGWQMLHDKLHKHNRYFAEGDMNDTPTTFETVRKSRDFAEFQISVCCDDNFDPSHIIQTAVGDLRVEKAEVDYFSGKNNNLATIQGKI